MDRAEKGAWLAIPIVIMIAAGVAWAGSQGGYKEDGIPIFTLGVVLAFTIQWIAFIPAWMMQTELYYDLTGSVTYISIILISILFVPETDLRSWILAAIIVVWTARLGYYLFTRIRTAGEDRRFHTIRKSFGRFLLAWTLQGLWVVLSMGAALAAITSVRKLPLDRFAIAGLLVWLSGFVFEVVADRQKREFRANPENKDKFIRSGLWSWSRHPNYFGEIVLWTGVAIIALPVLRGWQWVTLISPVFVTVLLTKISGIPLLEAHADEKWGGQSDYEAYKAGTSLLIPRPPHK